MNSILQTKLEIRSIPPEMEKKNSLVSEAEKMIEVAKREKRSLSQNEQNRFDSIKSQIKDLDQKLNADFQKDKSQMRSTDQKEKRSMSNLEVRGYKKNESIGNGNKDVTIGDLIYSHITGRYRNEEVRASLSTTSGGLSIPTEVYENFIDLLRNQSFLGETTVFPMSSQTLLIPRVTGDIATAFKLENDEIVESDPAFASVSLQAKPLYALTSISLELIESSNLDVGAMVTNIIAKAMQNSMQNFMLFGATNGYAGILNDTGINTTTLAAGSTVGYADIGTGVKAIMDNNGVPNAVIGSSDTLMNLELLTDTMGQFIKPPQFYQDLNKFSLNGTGLGGDVIVTDLSSIAWGILSEGGLQIEINKYGDAFTRGQIQVRARINGDFQLTNPKLVSHIDVP